jgi:hypothetical protein
MSGTLISQAREREAARAGPTARQKSRGEGAKGRTRTAADRDTQAAPLLLLPLARWEQQHAAE